MKIPTLILRLFHSLLAICIVAGLLFVLLSSLGIQGVQAHEGEPVLQGDHFIQKIETVQSAGISSPTAPKVGINGAGCAYDTIQEAINAASPGDSIEVSAGTYPEFVSITETLTIAGDYNGACTTTGGGLTTIDGFTLADGTLVEIDGAQVTLRDLRIVDADGGASSWGGGIHLTFGAVVILDNVDVLRNTAAYGGGIYIEPGAVMTATNGSYIASNIATSLGGGLRVRGTFTAEDRSDIEDNNAVFGGGIAVYDGMVTLDDTWLRYNQATGGVGKGGGIYAENGSTINITNSSLLSNNVAYDGAGIYADDSTVNVQIGFFYTNSASNNGGGIHLANNAELTGGAFRIGGEDAILGNLAENGAGIYAITSTINITGGQIYANVADISGGGIYLDNAVSNLYTVTVGGTNYDQPNKVAGGCCGAGIYMYNGSEATLYASVVAGNEFVGGPINLGGGIHASFGSTLLLEHNSRVEEHVAPHGMGAGIYASKSQVTIDDSKVTSNTVNTRGGGIHLSESLLDLQNNAVISNNEAENDVGGGIASQGMSEINISNTTMQINKAGTDGGAIYIEGGTLDLSGWWDLRWNSASGIGGGIMITGTADADLAVTSGENNSYLAVNTAKGGGGGGLYLNNSDTVNLHAVDGYRLNFNTNSATGWGGGAAAVGGGTLDVLGDVFASSNHADEGGGVVYLENASTLNLTSSGIDQPQFTVNWADSGGGVYATGGSFVNCAGGIFGSGTPGNRADVSDGGAIFLEDSTLQSVNCTFRNNEAVHDGGAIAAHNSSVIVNANYADCDPLTESCSSFYGNEADSDADNDGFGGGIYLYDGAMDVNHSIFHNNSAYGGGAIYQTGEFAVGVIKNSLFYRNDVIGMAGSAVRVYWGDFSMEHSTLANNTGAPAFSTESPYTYTVKIYNSIAWDNTGGFEGTTFTSYDCNIDQDGIIGIVEDPLFIDPGAGDDYHLGAGSPAVDVCSAGLLLDLDGNFRPINGLYDMGAYERFLHIFLPLVVR